MSTHRERPILFSGFKVPFILGLKPGEEAQTRRVITDYNSQGNFRASELLLDDPRTFVDGGPSPAGNPGPYLHAYVNAPAINKRLGWTGGGIDPEIIERLYPRVFPGDLLYVKETWAEMAPGRKMTRVAYRADMTAQNPLGVRRRRDPVAERLPADWRPAGGWKSGRFMPTKYARTFLEVTENRAQRLQEISEEDARAEGAYNDHSTGDVLGFHATIENAYRRNFALLWESLNHKRAPWESNPWCWAYTFKRLEGSKP